MKVDDAVQDKVVAAMQLVADKVKTEQGEDFCGMALVIAKSKYQIESVRERFGDRACDVVATIAALRLQTGIEELGLGDRFKELMVAANLFIDTFFAVLKENGWNEPDGPVEPDTDDVNIPGLWAINERNQESKKWMN